MKAEMYGSKRIVTILKTIYGRLGTVIAILNFLNA